MSRFTGKGEMLISSFIGEGNQTRLHIFKELKVDFQPSTRLLKYLEYHRGFICEIVMKSISQKSGFNILRTKCLIPCIFVK